MNNLFTTYKARLQILSSVVTPFHADTLFGTFCWSIAFLEGEKGLRSFLQLYKTEETIPLIISDGFMDGYLPRPVLKPLSLKEIEGEIEILINELAAEKDTINKIRYIDLVRDIKNIAFLPVEYLRENKDRFSQKKLLIDYLKVCTGNSERGTSDSLQDKIELYNKLIKDIHILRTSIDRYTGRAMEGRLFNTVENFYDSQVNIYIKLRRGKGLDINWLKNIFSYIELSGYGADKSTGKGQIKVEIEEADDLPHADNPNAFVSLSSFVPDTNTPFNGWYVPLLKYGKLGEHYANSSIDKIAPETGKKIGHNPFKRPILMFKAGAVFKLKNGERLRPFYGKIIENIHWDSEIVHYGFAYPLGIRLE